MCREREKILEAKAGVLREREAACPSWEAVGCATLGALRFSQYYINLQSQNGSK